jgi:hypothetical protein
VKSEQNGNKMGSLQTLFIMVKIIAPTLLAFRVASIFAHNYMKKKKKVAAIQL